MPVLLLWSTGHLGDGTSATVLAVVPLLASAYQFCRVDAKTEDHLFLGFPSYWNIAAFYVVVLDLRPTAVAVVLLVCAVLVFVPVGYVYPSRTTTLQATTLALTCLWLASYAVILAQLPDPSGVVAGDLGGLRRLLRRAQPPPHAPPQPYGHRRRLTTCRRRGVRRPRRRG